MIKTQNVHKYYNTFHALDDVNFEIGRGEVVGFLGQNGAGKTTLMRILTTYLPFSSGTIEVAGHDVVKQSLKVRQAIGYLPETPPLYPQMNVFDYLKFAAQLKDVRSRDIKKEIDRVASDCQLQNVLKSPIANLSKGYKQRIGIAQALIHNPSILILDEPTSGLDPLQVQQVRKVIRNLQETHTVLLSTHILSEMEHLADRILMIKEGRIITDDSLKNIIEQHSSLENAFLAKVQS